MNGSLTRRLALIGAAGLALSVAALTTGAGPATAAGEEHLTLKQLLGDENDAVDEAPALNALCQSFLGQPNPYGNPAPNVDQINGDTVVTVGSQTGCNSAQNETAIAVNPENPRNIVAGANDYRVFNSREQRNDSSGVAYTSFDGGRTWTNVGLPKLTFQTGGVGAFSWFDAAGDPVLAFGPHNTVYYGNIAFSRNAFGGGQMASAIVVNVSHDGGLHWGDPVALQIDGVNPDGTPVKTNVFNDKLWIAADPHSGRAYISWTSFQHDDAQNYLESPIVVSTTRDFGRTWTAQNRVSPTVASINNSLTPFAQGSNPQIGRDGTLYIAYETAECATAACDQPTDRDVTVVATSTDRGRTFRHAIVDTNFDFPLDEDTGSLGLSDENFRINSYPQLAYDRDRDQLWVTWADDRNGTVDPTTGEPETNGDNIVASSRDGRHWSAPQVVGTPQDEVFGAIAANDGVVALTSYTRHYDPTGINLDYAYWQAGRHGFAGARIHRITTASENPQVQFVGTGAVSGDTLQGLFIGDYSGVALGSDNRLHPCWTDFRGNPGVNTPNQEAYTQSIRLDD